FQAAWAVAGTYLSIVLSGLVQYFNPKMARAQGRELQAVVDECAGYVLRYVVPLCLLGICFGSLVIHVLYSERFGPAATVLDLLLCAAPMRALSWSYCTTLPMRNHARAYF